jgi:hypothetical protein
VINLQEFTKITRGRWLSEIFTHEELSKVNCYLVNVSFNLIEQRINLRLVCNLYPRIPPKRWLKNGSYIAFTLKGVGSKITIKMSDDTAHTESTNYQQLDCFEFTDDGSLYCKTNILDMHARSQSWLLDELTHSYGADRTESHIGRTIQ